LRYKWGAWKEREVAEEDEGGRRTKRTDDGRYRERGRSRGGFKGKEKKKKRELLREKIEHVVQNL
jgi:hypothetical protein